MADDVRNPKHYQGKGGVECIEVAEHLPFNVGGAFKYLYRRDEKGNRDKDLAKALWFIQRERSRRAAPPAENSDLILKTYKISESDSDRTIEKIMEAVVEGHVLNSDKSFELAESLLEEYINGPRD